jgi:pimeloyl-ACP methyl ester carboxylesterase
MIHALPGMGADNRMFPHPWSELPDFIAHDWPPYRGEGTIGDFSDTLVETFGIEDGDTLVGSSLGGMVACEIAKIRKLGDLFLVGSAVNKTEVNRLLAIIHPLAYIAPIEWLKFSAGSIPSDLAQMFSSTDASFIRSMCAAIFDWDGLGEHKLRCHRIHGKKDFVIPPPEKADLLLDGGHLISITHAAQCAGYVRDNLTR